MADPAVFCRGLRYSFGKKVAVDGVDLDVEPGKIFGLLGPNGAGKTTTIRMLVTLLKAASGDVRVFGLDAKRKPMAVRRLLGYVPQALSADSEITGRENVALFARLFDVPRRERAGRVAQVLDSMGLTDVADQRADTYSGGMVRRLELAQALVSTPRLLVLDEPTVGLDPVARDSVWSYMEEMRERTGMTILLTTHYMEEADALCDRIALMHKGKIAASGTPTELKSALGPAATLNDVFRHYAGEALSGEGGAFSSVKNSRRTARRLG